MKRSLVLKTMSVIASVVLAGGLLAGCSGAGTSAVKITINGSTSVDPLMQKVKTAYEAKNSNVTLELQATGSGSGIQAAIDGNADIGTSSRELKSEEAEKLNPTVIAMDGIAVIVNTENTKATSLTKAQIKDIFTGKIKNWKEVGGDDKEIVVVSREAGSGTRGAFEEIIGYKEAELVSTAVQQNSTGSVKEKVKTTSNAIGFISLGSLDATVKAVKYDGVEPTEAGVLDGTYKLKRPFLACVKKDSDNPEVKKLFDFILGEEGQKLVKEEKFIPVK